MSRKGKRVQDGATTKPDLPKKGARFSRKRELIIRAAAQAFGRKGFHATTLDEIAAELDVTKASIYYYFETKEELLYEVHLLSMQQVTERLERILERGGPPVELLQDAIREHLRLLDSDYEGRILLQQEYELAPNYREEVLRLRRDYERKFRSIVEEGAATCVPRQGSQSRRAHDPGSDKLVLAPVPFGRPFERGGARGRLHRFFPLRAARTLRGEPFRSAAGR